MEAKNYVHSSFYFMKIIHPYGFTYFHMNMIMWKHKFVFWTSQRYHSFVSFKANKLNYI